jgi:putative SOS response-associated peptidase YedK
MCGRFTLTARLELLEERFAFQATDLPYTPSYNIAPGQPVLTVIHAEEGSRARYARWGLVPSWAKDPAIGNRMINARVETVADKPSFRQALRRQRCLVLADGFYEWQHLGKTKQPMYISLHGHRPFAFAGLWDVWQAPTGTPLYTCTILTTTANTLLRPVHHRMPVLLDPAAEAYWLDQNIETPDILLPLLQPYPPAQMQMHPVTRLVNSPLHNSPACITPLAPEGLHQ